MELCELLEYAKSIIIDANGYDVEVYCGEYEVFSNEDIFFDMQDDTLTINAKCDIELSIFDPIDYLQVKCNNFNLEELEVNTLLVEVSENCDINSYEKIGDCKVYGQDGDVDLYCGVDELLIKCKDSHVCIMEGASIETAVIDTEDGDVNVSCKGNRIAIKTNDGGITIGCDCQQVKAITKEGPIHIDGHNIDEIAVKAEESDIFVNVDNIGECMIDAGSSDVEVYNMYFKKLGVNIDEGNFDITTYCSYNLISLVEGKTKQMIDPNAQSTLIVNINEGEMTVHNQ